MMSKDERRVCLSQMEAAAGNFYRAATAIGNHPFIEFTGLMNEYTKLCFDAHNAGIDFTECSAHSGVPLPIPDYSLRYIAEKLECIFQGALRVSPKPPDGMDYPDDSPSTIP